jgi:hypothetical protein
VNVHGLQQFDFDNVYRLAMRQMEQDSFDYLSFVCAVEMLAEKMGFPGHGEARVGPFLEMLEATSAR